MCWQNNRTGINLGSNRWAFKPRVFPTLRTLGPRCLRGSMVLHHESRTFLSQHVRPRRANPDRTAHRRIRRTAQLRRQATFVGFAGREFLAWRQNQFEWSSNSAQEFPSRRHGFGYPSLVRHTKLQQRRVRALRRQLSKRFRGLEILLDRMAEITLPRYLGMTLLYVAEAGQTHVSKHTVPHRHVREGSNIPCHSFRIVREITEGCRACSSASHGTLN